MSKQLIIKFEASPKQAQAYLYLTDTITSEIGYGGGAGGGKSWLGCFWLISQCLSYPGVAYVMGRTKLTILKKTTLVTFFKVCQAYGIGTQYYTYNQQENTIKWMNGSIIFLMNLGYEPSDHLYTRLGGLELTGAFIDESNESRAQGINILMTRIGRCKNDVYNILPKMFETFNPAKNHVYSRYFRPWKDCILPIYRKFIKALT